MTDKSENHIRQMITEGLGLDITDPNLSDTPKRISKMYGEFFESVNVEFEGMTTFPNEKGYDQIILMDRIHFTSICSHHFLPFDGYAWFGYIPDEKLLGASKPARIIAHYSKRPQLQENLCHDVLNCIESQLQPLGSMLVMRAIHGCMSSRGICQYNNAGMITSAVSGVFKESKVVKDECLDLIKLSMMIV